MQLRLVAFTLTCAGCLTGVTAVSFTVRIDTYYSMQKSSISTLAQYVVPIDSAQIHRGAPQ